MTERDPRWENVYAKIEFQPAHWIGDEVQGFTWLEDRYAIIFEIQDDGLVHGQVMYLNKAWVEREPWLFKMTMDVMVAKLDDHLDRIERLDGA